MALHMYYSAFENQRFQPGCSTDMVQFFNHEAYIEDDAVAAELDKLIEKGAVPHIRRIQSTELEKEVERQAENLKALKAKAAAMSNQGAAVGGMTTTENMRAIAADSLSVVNAPQPGAKK